MGKVKTEVEAGCRTRGCSVSDGQTQVAAESSLSWVGDKDRDAGAGVDLIKERSFPGAGGCGQEPTKAGGENAAKEGAIERGREEGAGERGLGEESRESEVGVRTSWC